MKITIFEVSGCPYCRQERQIIEELIKEHPEYGDLTIERIDEALEPGLADQYDYYYVPSIFAGEEKLYEADPAWSRDEAKLRIGQALSAAVSQLS